MIDGHGHPVAAEAQIAADPYQIAGVVVDVACTGPAGGVGGVVPIALQTVVIAEVNLQGGAI